MPITTLPTHRHLIGELAAYVDTHHIDETDLRDTAADVDNGLVDGEPHLMIALTATLTDQSATTTVLELFGYLGWQCDHGHPLAGGCKYCD